MRAVTSASLLALRDADPAADADVRALCPDWDSVLAQFTAESAESVAAIESDAITGATDVTDATGATDVTDVTDVTGVTDEPGGATEPAGVEPVPTRSGAIGTARARRRPHRLRLAAAAALVSAAAIAAGVVAWPWSDSGPSSVAYGVTKQSNGTVVVRPAPNHPFTSTDLQAQLRAAGVPAVVLVESPPADCTEPAPTTIPSNGSVITHPSNLPRDVAFVIDPATLPTGAVLVVAMTPISVEGARSATGPAFADLFVTRQAPTCIAQQSRVQTSASRPSTAPS